MAGKPKEKKVKKDAEVAYALRTVGRKLDALLVILADHVEEGLVERVEKMVNIDINKDGKIGSWSIGNVIATAVAGLCLCAATLFAQGDIVDWTTGDGQNNGTAYIDSDQAGTATLTIDEVVGNVTGDTAGDVTADDINMNGAVGDTLGFNDGKAVTVTGLVATVNFANITAADIGNDTDYVQYKWLSIYNSTTQTIDWAYWNVVIDDNTTNTEDSAVELYIQVNGTATVALNVDATAVDCGTLPVYATGGDLGDGTLANVGAITADSIAPDGTDLDVTIGGGDVSVNGMAGYNGAITNDFGSSSNVMWFGEGIMTNLTTL